MLRKTNLFLLLILLVSSSVLYSKPIYTRMYKQTYGYIPSCNSCHKDGGGSNLSTYGEAFKKNGSNLDAFSKMAGVDSDGDGITNENESKAKSNPGDKTSTPTNLGNWLDSSNVVPKDVQNLFPKIRTWMLKDAVLTSTDIEESKKMGATLSATDENTIYVPVENNLPTGTGIIFPVQMEGKAFYLLMTTDKTLTITQVKLIDSKNYPGAKSDDLYKSFIGKKPKEIIVSQPNTLQGTISQAVKNAGILLYVRLKGA